MKMFAAIAAFAIVAATPAFAQDAAAAPAVATQGRMLYAAGGKQLAAVYRVDADGSPRVILDGKLVRVPATSLSMDSGKLTTTLTKKDLRLAN